MATGEDIPPIYELPPESRGEAPGRGRMLGRRVVVVGAGQTDFGIADPPVGNGRAISLLLAREGARVVAVDRNASAAEATVELIEAAGGQATARGVEARGLGRDLRGEPARGDADCARSAARDEPGIFACVHLVDRGAQAKGKVRGL